ncbi:hypothetical protein QL285_008042 [Trifolium repens]|nr:hypothetical protein QL285_008042 [Trifolium repens]
MASNSGQRANNEFSSRSGARYLFARSRGCGEPVYGDCVGDCSITGMNGYGIKNKGIRTRLLNGQQMLPTEGSAVQRRRVKPNTGELKCNVDAAFHRSIDKTSYGCCLRDKW